MQQKVLIQPVDDKLALHTAARRYCLQRAPALDPDVRERDFEAYHRAGDSDLKHEQDNSASDWRAMALRADVLGSILFGIERVTPDEFATTEELRDYLVTVGHETGPEPPEWDVSPRPTAEDLQEALLERSAFRAYVESLTQSDLMRVAPLPYRRVLREQEEDTIWSLLEHHWDVSPRMLWYPFESQRFAGLVVEFTLSELMSRISLQVVRDVLKARGIERVWHLREHGAEYDVDVTWLVPFGGEECWTSADMSWILYVSHEGYLIAGGEWFVRGIVDLASPPDA